MHRVAADSRVPATQGAQNLCRCGCKRPVQRTFAQGHDQVFLANLRSEVIAGRQNADWALAQASGISAPFVAKVAKSMATIASRKAQTARKETPIGAAA
jgi:hypothetical protein